MQWLLELIQLPPEEFDKHQRQARNLSDRLAVFSDFSPKRFKPLRSAQIARLVSEIRAGVHDLRVGKPWEVRVSASIRLQPVRKGNPQVKLHYTDNLAAAFLSSAIQRVGSQYERIAECEAPGCRRLFVKRKVRHYCSQKCSQRMRSSRYYELHREELSKRRHDSYVGRIKREKGAARVVQMRKRRPAGEVEGNGKSVAPAAGRYRRPASSQSRQGRCISPLFGQHSANRATF